jgi:hypothetical protein
MDQHYHYHSFNLSDIHLKNLIRNKLKHFNGSSSVGYYLISSF